MMVVACLPVPSFTFLVALGGPPLSLTKGWWSVCPLYPPPIFLVTLVVVVVVVVVVAVVVVGLPPPNSR